MSVTDILNGAWAIQPAYLEMIQNIYLERRGQKLTAEGLKDIEAALGKPLNNNSDKRYEVRSGVAIIPVMGSMIKRGNMFSDVSGMTSYEAIQRDIKQAAADPEVLAAVLNIDSPGGMVNGTASTAEAIRAFGLKKPIAAWTDGMMTSAAQWLGAATGNVYIGNDTTQLGSIGVIGRHQDISAAEAMGGVKTTIMTAGKYKGVGHPHAPLSAEHQALMQGSLDYAYSAFVNAMADYRGATVENVLANMAEGRVFNGQQAIDVGLADGMMSLEECCTLMKEKCAAYPAQNTATTARGFHATAEHNMEVTSMDRELLQNEHAALFAEVLEEGRKEGAATALAEERSRVATVLSLPAAGHQDLIKAALTDGSSAEQLSMKILQAEATQRQNFLEAAANGSKAVAAAEAPAEGSEEARAMVAAAVQGGSVATA